MYRYLVFHTQKFTPESPDKIQAAISNISQSHAYNWTRAYSSPRVEIWQSGQSLEGMKTIILPDKRIMLGRVFAKDIGFKDWVPCSLTDRGIGPDPVELANWLTSNVWGKYVALLSDSGDEQFSIFRDPVGELPCYRVKWDIFDIFTSNVELVSRLPGLRITANLNSMYSNIVFPFVCKDSTCLNGVSKVLPGECLHLGRREHRTFHWNLLEISRKGTALSTEDAAAAMRDTLKDVVFALGRPYKHVLHSLGGLDSSIILSCLVANSSIQKATCLNFFTDSFSGDERHFARITAAHARRPLIERRLEPELVNLDIWAGQEMGESPPAMFDSVIQAGDILAIAEQENADVLCSGVVGDGILFEAPHIFSALDYVTEKGKFRYISRVALEAAQNGGQSLAHTFWRMFLEKTFPDNCFDSTFQYLNRKNATELIGSDWMEDMRRPDNIHPMIKPSASFAKGKYYHVLGSCFPDLERQRRRFPNRIEIDSMSPMAAQPFVELCLQIPTWQLVDGGVGRGLARRAFWNDLPKEILGRTSKATDQGLYSHLFSRNARALREALLDGVLAKSGFFDRARIELAFCEDRDMAAVSDNSILFDMFAWEAWARRWVA